MVEGPLRRGKAPNEAKQRIICRTRKTDQHGLRTEQHRLKREHQRLKTKATR